MCEPLDISTLSDKQRPRASMNISHLPGSTRALACTRRRLAGGPGVRTHHAVLQAVSAGLRRGAASSTRGACAPQTEM